MRLSPDGIEIHSTDCSVRRMGDFSNTNATTVVVVSGNTVSSKYLTFNNLYFDRKSFLQRTSKSRGDKKNPAGIIKIPPAQASCCVKDVIKHLYRSFVSYLSNISFLSHLFRARYGGLVRIQASL